MTAVPAEAITAAQDYDLAHRNDTDQPRRMSWGRVPDDQVARLLEGAAPLIAAAERDRIRQDARAEHLAMVHVDAKGRPVACWHKDGGTP